MNKEKILKEINELFKDNNKSPIFWIIVVLAFIGFMVILIKVWWIILICAGVYLYLKHYRKKKNGRIKLK